MNKKRFLYMMTVIAMLVITTNLHIIIAQGDSGDIPINEKYFPDAGFRKVVSIHSDDNEDGILSVAEINWTKIIDISSGDKVNSLKGIEYFPNLEELTCYNNEIKDIDISKNMKLKKLVCYNNKISKLDVTKNTKLELLSCGSNLIKKLDVTKNTKLESLQCGNNLLNKLDVTSLKKLKELSFINNRISNIDLSQNTELVKLYCQENELKELYLSNNKKIEEVRCQNNKLSAIDLSNNKKLNRLHIDGNKIKSLDMRNNRELEKLICNDNLLTSIDLNKNTKITNLICYNNKIKELDITNCTDLYGRIMRVYYDLDTSGNVSKEHYWIRGCAEGEDIGVYGYYGAVIYLDPETDVIIDGDKKAGYKYYEGTSDTKTKYPFLDRPVVQYEANGNSVTLTWNVVENVKKYFIYRKYKDEKFKKIGNVTTNKYTDTNLALGEYTYFVTASDGIKFYEDYDVDPRQGLKSRHCNVKVTSKKNTNTITVKNVNKTAKAKEQTFNLNAKQTGDAKLTYSSNKSKVKVTSKGQVTIAKNFSGVAVITITAPATKQYAKATAKATITVKPKKTAIKEIAKASSTSVKVKWTENKTASGYEIQYSTDKNFNNDVKSVIVSKQGTTSKKIKKLVGGNTYYFRMRAISNVGGKTYSKWSATKHYKCEKESIIMTA